MFWELKVGYDIHIQDGGQLRGLLGRRLDSNCVGKIKETETYAASMR